MLRSLLFVPAKEKMLKKISSLSSDGYIIDLEDSIREEEKDYALRTLCEFLATSNQLNVYIRLNKERVESEAIALNMYNVGFMLPKFESIDDYQSLAGVLGQHEIIALIETPKGIVNISSIASTQWVDALAFGAEDYTASMNMENDDELLLFPKSTLVTYAKTFSKKVFDTPSFSINDQEKFEKEVRTSVSLGFDGKLLINPRHIEFINSSFGKADFEYVKYIVSEYERKGEAVVVIEGKIYEKMHINHYRKILKENNINI